MRLSNQLKVYNQGFTIVELLIVIVVIAILAAISIATYNGIQSRAHKTAVSSDLSTIAKKLEVYKIDNGAYPHAATGHDTADELNTIDFKASASNYAEQGGNLLYITDINATNGTRYALLAVPKMGTALVISSDNRQIQPYNNSAAPFPGSGYGNIAEQLGFESPSTGNTVTYNAYSINNGFRIWN